MKKSPRAAQTWTGHEGKRPLRARSAGRKGGAPRARPRAARLAGAARASRCGPPSRCGRPPASSRVRLHGRFRKRGTEYVSVYGMKGMVRWYKVTMQPSPSVTSCCSRRSRSPPAATCGEARHARGIPAHALPCAFHSRFVVDSTALVCSGLLYFVYACTKQTYVRVRMASLAAGRGPPPPPSAAARSSCRARPRRARPPGRPASRARQPRRACGPGWRRAAED